jgi:hypothetical protein
MSATETMLLNKIADEQGQVSVETPDFAIEFSIRSESLERYESEFGDLLLRTPEMPIGVYLEIQPHIDGVTQEIVVEPERSLTRLDVIEPAETEASNTIGIQKYRMD